MLLVTAAAGLWIAQAFGLSRLMRSHGFDPLPWFGVSLLLGPAMWPLALIDLISGPPGSELLRRGQRGGGAVDVFVAFERDELPQATADQIKRLLPRSDRLVLARVIRAGGPSFIPTEAQQFLGDAASRLGARKAELRLFYGVFADVVRDMRDDGDFDVVLRSDVPNEPFEGNGSHHEMRCLHDATAA